MDTNEEGQEEISKVILLQFNGKTLDKCSFILGSNVFENYLAIIAKFTEGKRLNMDGSAF